ncbi:hypothetical protein DFR38_101109 [Aquitalea magnusonii]|uniref:Uncharacterized protein n=1 Tax=Aquitalea magnusonii TaxID=332411 RepID=A0A318JM95_9NEIS|nr:hypothetical protein DFR38_101109 [Aquitalea magnusonii]
MNRLYRIYTSLAPYLADAAILLTGFMIGRITA